MLFPKLGEADRGDKDMGSELEGLGGRRGGGMGGGIGGGTAGPWTAPQTSNAARLALDGRGGTGGILGCSVVGEVPGRGDTVPASFEPLSVPSCPSPLA